MRLDGQVLKNDLELDPPLVSVIIPSFNCRRYIIECLESVSHQTYKNIEIIVVDDASSDGTNDLVGQYRDRDPRVTLLSQPKNGGVALARNAGLSIAKGRYVAYLDSDDIWYSEKIAHQMSFMRERDSSICITDYRTIEEDGRARNIVRVPASIRYRQFLKKTTTCSSSIMVDLREVDRDLLLMPDLRRGQDAATWLQVMRAGFVFTGLNEVLVGYRKRAGSLSSNIFVSVKRTWNVYRRAEELSAPYAAYCLTCQVAHAAIKRMPGTHRG